jgi:hypothetical protein
LRHPVTFAVHNLRRSRSFWLAVALSFFFGAMSLTGRYDLTPNMDLCADTMNAWRLVHEGAVPLPGSVSSLYALNTPGIAYGLAPGLVVFPHHPVAAERFGAALLFAGCLVGLCLWLRSRLGENAAALAVLLFAVGQSGAFFAMSLWPRAHPFFYIWFLYFLTLWIERRDGRFLAAALVVYVAGLYWFMEIAPALFVVPVLWALYRTPLRIRHLVVAALAGLVIWSPYLWFETGRNFADLRSLATQRPLHEGRAVSDLVASPGNHFVNAWDVPALRAAAAKNPTPVATPVVSQPAEVAMKPAATGLRQSGPFANFGGTQSAAFWTWHVALMAAALAFAVAKMKPWRLFRKAVPSVAPAPVWGVLVVGVLVPLVLMVALVPGERLGFSDRRFWWLWSAEAATMGAALGSFVFRGRRWGVCAGALAVATLAMNPWFFILTGGAFSRWPGNGHGPDGQAIAALAKLVKAEGRSEAAIGYDVNQPDWMPATRRADGAGKCAMNWDVALWIGSGIRNLDTTAEGLSPQDEFRVFSPDYDVRPTDIAHLRWSLTLDGTLPAMDKVAEAGGYDILRRRPAQ